MRYLLFILSLTAHASESRFDAFQNLAKTHREKISEEGLGYMVGGALGVGISLTLGITSEEPLPKIGYSLIQALSSASIGYGASLYYYGDGFTQEADRLKDLETRLKSGKMSNEETHKILDDMTTISLKKEIDHYRKMKKIRGYVELTSAAAGIATMSFSKSRSSASNIATGFLVLLSSLGAYGDLLGPDNPKSFQDLYTLRLAPVIDPIQKRASLALNLLW